MENYLGEPGFSRSLMNATSACKPWFVSTYKLRLQACMHLLSLINSTFFFANVSDHTWQASAAENMTKPKCA